MSETGTQTYRIAEGVTITPINGFPNYAVSRCGKVWSYKNKIWLVPTNSGYCKYHKVHLCEGKKITQKLIHRLVAEYFLDDYSEELTVNHKDFIKDNNRLSNLEMMTNYENILDFIEKVKKEKTYSRVVGVGYHKQIDKWTARVMVDNKRKSLGIFNTKEEAEFKIRNYSNKDIKEETIL